METFGAAIRLKMSGSGPPDWLLHGYPQFHAMWHKAALGLSHYFTIIAADLRGYGDSVKPLGGKDHAGYSKRAMAADQVEVMAALGFERFAVVGRDRGGRVSHRMAPDHPDCVERLMVLNIVPTWKIFAQIDKQIATDYYHWFFLVQDFDFPESLIVADSEYYLRAKLGKFSTSANDFMPEAMTEYLRCISDPTTIHASCEDCRAPTGIDLLHDEADLTRQPECPVLAL